MYGSVVRKTGSGLVLACGVVMCLAGCGRSEGGPLETPQDRGNAQASDPQGSGTDTLLHLSTESTRYIGVETVGSKPDPLPLRLPARLEFKDGALSEVGTPMFGPGTRSSSCRARTPPRLATPSRAPGRRCAKPRPVSIVRTG
jgi:predicted small lipoprotein YifL